MLRLYRLIETMDAAAPLPSLGDQAPAWAWRRRYNVVVMSVAEGRFSSSDDGRQWQECANTGH